jgi:DNA-directed RNA polymerase specialized sigma subunit
LKNRNQEIREAVRHAGLFLWEIAEAYGISDSNFSRLLRKELDADTKARIYSIIAELSKSKKIS